MEAAWKGSRQREHDRFSDQQIRVRRTRLLFLDTNRNDRKDIVPALSAIANFKCCHGGRGAKTVDGKVHGMWGGSPPESIVRTPILL